MGSVAPVASGAGSPLSAPGEVKCRDGWR